MLCVWESESASLGQASHYIALATEIF